MPPHAQATDLRSPYVGDPIDTLPKIDAPKVQKPAVQITTGDPNRALVNLLAQPITPTHFAIEGVKSLPFNQVANQFAPLAGKRITINDLIRAADSVTRLYQEYGYVLSFCFIPAQDFANGNVKITVVEGHVDKIVLRGNPGGAERKIREIASSMLADVPLRRVTFERTINLLSQLPGMHISASVPPPQTLGGATELQLNVSRKSVSLGTGLVLNHPGVRGMFTLSANSLTPLAEQTTLSVLAPRGRDNEEYYAGSLALPVGSNGMLFKLDGSHYHGRPQNVALSSLSLERRVTTDRVGATLSYPFVLDNTHSLIGSLSFYGSNNSDMYVNTMTGMGLINMSNVRVLQTNVAYAASSTGQVRRLNVGLSHGFDILGASRDVLSSFGSGVGNFDLNFNKVTLEGSQSNDWPLSLGTVVSFASQYSSNALPSSEQIAFGNQRFGLAYPAGEIAGDSGWAASFEVNRGFPANWDYLKQVKPYLLYDTARVSLNQARLQHNRIASIAAGVRFTDNQHYNLDLSIAKPVGQEPVESNNRSARVNASFSYQFD